MKRSKASGPEINWKRVVSLRDKFELVAVAENATFAEISLAFGQLVYKQVRVVPESVVTRFTGK